MGDNLCWCVWVLRLVFFLANYPPVRANRSCRSFSSFSLRCLWYAASSDTPEESKLLLRCTFAVFPKGLESVTQIRYNDPGELSRLSDNGDHIDWSTEELLHNISRQYVPRYHQELEGIMDEFFALFSKKPAEGPPIGEVTPMKVFIHNVHEEILGKHYHHHRC